MSGIRGPLGRIHPRVSRPGMSRAPCQLIPKCIQNTGTCTDAFYSSLLSTRLIGGGSCLQKKKTLSAEIPNSLQNRHRSESSPAVPMTWLNGRLKRQLTLLSSVPCPRVSSLLGIGYAAMLNALSASRQLARNFSVKTPPSIPFK